MSVTTGENRRATMLTNENSDSFIGRLKRCLDDMDENNEIEIIMDRDGLELCINALAIREAGDAEIERLNRVDETMEEVDADIRAAFRTEKIHSLQSQIATLTAERDEARKDKLYLGLELDRVKAELADLARRSIAARQEVVGLLKWLKDKSESGLSITYLLQSNNPESVKKASRILQIIEGEGE